MFEGISALLMLQERREGISDLLVTRAVTFTMCESTVWSLEGHRAGDMM